MATAIHVVTDDDGDYSTTHQAWEGGRGDSSEYNGGVVKLLVKGASEIILNKSYIIYEIVHSILMLLFKNRK